MFGTLAAAAALALVSTTQAAQAVGTVPDLGTADAYSVLAGTTVTNTGPSDLNGSVGVHDGSAITGFPPGESGGVFHAGDAEALQAKSDLTAAYNDAAGQASDASIGTELGGLTLTPGVYTADSSTQLTGVLTLDAQGDPSAVFIFQIGSGLTTASGSSVVLINDAQGCNVFWQVGESVSLGTGTEFVGTIMALTSISAGTGADVEGRALARNGAVTLDTNRFTAASCSTVSTSSPSPTVTVSPTDTGSPTATDTSTGTPTGTDSPSSTPTETLPASTESATIAGVGAESDQGVDSRVDALAFTGGGPYLPVIAVAVGTALIGLVLILGTRRRSA